MCSINTIIYINTIKVKFDWRLYEIQTVYLINVPHLIVQNSTVQVILQTFFFLNLFFMIKKKKRDKFIIIFNLIFLKLFTTKYSVSLINTHYSYIKCSVNCHGFIFKSTWLYSGAERPLFNLSIPDPSLPNIISHWTFKYNTLQKFKVSQKPFQLEFKLPRFKL